MDECFRSVGIRAGRRRRPLLKIRASTTTRKSSSHPRLYECTQNTHTHASAHRAKLDHQRHTISTSSSSRSRRRRRHSNACVCKPPICQQRLFKLRILLIISLEIRVFSNSATEHGQCAKVPWRWWWWWWPVCREVARMHPELETKCIGKCWRARLHAARLCHPLFFFLCRPGWPVDRALGAHAHPYSVHIQPLIRYVMS